ncbi:AbiTii domain-containing protein [Nocardiopsis dassonvillei]|uniref:AbiTii domain-containing protein n=1 Tax=Nocardiopsis dassonvillei TaxID=2014 RepID=UPI0033E7A198
MSLLDQIIHGASESSVPTVDLLRKIRVVSHRIHASETTEWVQYELEGYPAKAPEKLPPYRGPITVPVLGTYSGPFQSSMSQYLTMTGIPEEAVPGFEAWLYQPIAELEALASSENEDPSMPWDPRMVMRWNTWEEEGKVPHPANMNLLFAKMVLPRNVLQGINDVIRNNALTFALELQAKYPEAGEINGPTTANPEVSQVVNTFTNNIYGSGNNLAFGDGNTQTVNIAQGDLPAVLEAASRLGLDNDARNELAAILVGDQEPEEKRSRLRVFADRVKGGSYTLAHGVAANLAATQVMEIGTRFLGLLPG